MIEIKKVIVDYRIDIEEKETLEKLGYEVLLCPPEKSLYTAVNGHPDILLHFTDNCSVVVHRDMDRNFIKKLELLNLNVTLSVESLSSAYPKNIGLNAVNFDNLFLHNLKYTDKALLEKVKNKKLINIKQGYTKCSTAILSAHAAMTSDTGISRALENEGIDVLLLPPGDIDLPGLDYGFIGGCCGLIEEDVISFYGHLDYYAYGKIVLKFLKKHKIEPIFLKNDKLIDRGSIFSLNL